MKYAIVRVLDEKTANGLMLGEDDSPFWLEFMPRYVEHSRTFKRASSVKTESTTLKRFTEFAGNPRIGGVTIDFADKWKALLLSRFTNNYVRSCLATMRSAFDYGITIRALGANPFMAIRLPKLKKAGRNLTDDEIKAFLHALPLWARRMCIVALCTGMRRSEVVNLRWEEIYGDYIILPKEKTKSGKERTVWIDPRANRYLGPRPGSGEGWVFEHECGYLNEQCTKAWKKIGLGRIRFHDLRHTYATRYYKKTKDLKGLMAQCGWASVQSAMTYQHGPNEKPKNLRLGYQF
jgi:integrase